MKKVEYYSNNSGGDWWLTDQNWYDLEAAGWKIEWCKDVHKPANIVDGRFIGTLAQSATRVGLNLNEAIAEWERITKECASDCGCACCGQPHDFIEYDDDKISNFGPCVIYEDESDDDKS